MACLILEEFTFRLLLSTVCGSFLDPDPTSPVLASRLLAQYAPYQNEGVGTRGVPKLGSTELISVDHFLDMSRPRQRSPEKKKPSPGAAAIPKYIATSSQVRRDDRQPVAEAARDALVRGQLRADHQHAPSQAPNPRGGRRHLPHALSLLQRRPPDHNDHQRLAAAPQTRQRGSSAAAFAAKPSEEAAKRLGYACTQNQYASRTALGRCQCEYCS